MRGREREKKKRRRRRGKLIVPLVQKLVGREKSKNKKTPPITEGMTVGVVDRVNSG